MADLISGWIAAAAVFIAFTVLLIVLESGSHSNESPAVRQARRRMELEDFHDTQGRHRRAARRARLR